MDKTPLEIRKIIQSITFPERKKEYNFVRNKRGYIESESRVIWEEHYGNIPQGGVIHHINGIKTDNRIENLMMFPSHVAHMNFHKHQNKIKKGESP